MLVAVGPAIAQTADFGPLEDVLVDGEAGSFTATRTDEALTLVNDDDPNGYRLFFSALNTKSFGLREATVQIRLEEGGELSHGGLVFGYEEEPLNFYLFALEPGNQVTLWRLTADAGTIQTRIRNDLVQEGETNALTVREDGNQITLLVNGTMVGLLGGLEGMGDGSFGIGAWGTGAYVFSGYSEISRTPTR